MASLTPKTARSLTGRTKGGMFSTTGKTIIASSSEPPRLSALNAGRKNILKDGASVHDQVRRTTFAFNASH